MGYFDINESPMEIAAMKYKGTGRFLTCLYPVSGKPLESQYELDFAIDAEITRMQNGIGKIPDMPKIKREFAQYSIEFKLVFLLCTRITNISKILFILKHSKTRKELESSVDRACIALKHICSVMQEEYHDRYGVYYNTQLNDQTKKYYVQGRNISFIEKIIYDDLKPYFKKSIFDWSVLYASHYNTLLQYMAVICLQMEVEMISLNLKDTSNIMKSEGASFAEYHNYLINANNEITFWSNFLEAYRSQVDILSIQDYLANHKLILME